MVIVGVVVGCYRLSYGDSWCCGRVLQVELW